MISMNNKEIICTYFINFVLIKLDEVNKVWSSLAQVKAAWGLILVYFDQDNTEASNRTKGSHECSSDRKESCWINHSKVINEYFWTSNLIIDSTLSWLDSHTLLESSSEDSVQGLLCIANQITLFFRRCIDKVICNKAANFIYSSYLECFYSGVNSLFEDSLSLV